jgi:stalled ribosome rescue protein Dom34
MWNGSCCTPIIRPSTFTIRQTPSGAGHAAEDHAFLQAVAQSIADAGAVLVTGPANAKTELLKHISQHDPALMKIIVGVETVDHPSDGQLVAYARRYFKAEDRMLPQKG